MKKSAILLLSLLLLFSFTAAAGPQTGSDQELLKDETVYVNLHADGSIKQIYVVNRIEAKKAGVYTDYGKYTNVTNLSGSQKPAINGDSISWQLDKEVLYYQGQLADGELPFSFSLEYRLDDNLVTPEEIIGKAGAVAINLRVEPNPKAKAHFRDNYLAQIQIPLDLEGITGIEAPGAAPVVAGRTATLAYTVLPGQKADYTLRFETRAFEMGSISISCLPFSSDSFLDLDLEEITEGFAGLTDGLDKLAGGSKKLQLGVIDLKEGLDQLAGGAGELAAGTSQLSAFLAGVGELQQGLQGLSAGLTQLKQGAAGVETGNKDLAQGIRGYTSAAGQISQNSQKLNAGLAQLSTEGDGLNAGYQQLASGLGNAIASLPQQLAPLNLSAEQQQALGQILAGMNAGLDSQLAAFGQGLREYTGGVGQAAGGFNELSLGLEAFAGQGQALATAADQLGAGSAALSQGLTEMAAGSGGLAGGLGAFAQQSQEARGGVEELAGGANALAAGLKEMAQEVSRLPGDVKALTDAHLRLRDGFNEAAGFLTDVKLPEGDSAPVSFVSDQVVPQSVQFVASTPSFKVNPEPPEAPETKVESNGFFARLLRLFGFKK